MNVHATGKPQKEIQSYNPLYKEIVLSEPDMKLASKFIKINKAALLEHWNGETDTRGFIDRLRSIF